MSEETDTDDFVWLSSGSDDEEDGRYYDAASGTATKHEPNVRVSVNVVIAAETESRKREDNMASVCLFVFVAGVFFAAAASVISSRKQT